MSLRIPYCAACTFFDGYAHVCRLTGRKMERGWQCDIDHADLDDERLVKGLHEYQRWRRSDRIKTMPLPYVVGKMIDAAIYKLRHNKQQPTMEEALKYGVTAICEAPQEEPANVRRLREIMSQLGDIYRRKNADYGNSFSVTVGKFGVGTALARMDDKLSRATQLLLHGNQQVNEEGIYDTLGDLATYAVMTIMELEKQSDNPYPGK